MTENHDTFERGQLETAATFATRAAEMALAAARVAQREETATRLMETTAQVRTAIAHEFSLPPILDVVLDQTVLALGGRLSYVYLADEDRRVLELAGWRNLPRDLASKLSTVPFDAPSVAAKAAASRQLQLVASLDELAPPLLLPHEVLSRMDCQSMAAMPLLARDRLVGVLVIAFATPHEFAAEERATLEDCAEVFSFGIANAILFEEECRLRSLFEAVGRATVAIAGELELRPGLQSIADEARAVTKAEYAAIGIGTSPDQPFDPWVYSGMTRAQAERIGRTPRPVGALGVAIAEGQTFRVADVSRHASFRPFPAHHPALTSFLSVPIREGDRTVGALYLANKRGGTEFSHADQEAVELLALHVAGIIRHGHLLEQLRGERARFSAIVADAPHGVLFIEISTGHVITNRRAIELAGEPEPVDTIEYRGRVFTPDGKPLPDRDWPALRALRGETVLPTELVIHRPDGKEVPVLVSASRIMSDGRPEGVVVLFEDISILKQLQWAREEWASLVTHDLRQPLSIITTSVGLLQRLAEAPDPRRLQRATDMMERASVSLNRMIADLADTSRLEAKQLTLQRGPVDLVVLVREILERQRLLTPGRKFALESARSLPVIDADPLRLEQILANLLGNAVKYSAPDSAITVAVRPEDSVVHVLVTNQGAGIPAGDLSKIFDRWYRTVSAKQGVARGLGLGLYIAKGLIEVHGGKIWAESTPGATTTFHFTLPLAEERGASTGGSRRGG